MSKRTTTEVRSPVPSVSASVKHRPRRRLPVLLALTAGLGLVALGVNREGLLRHYYGRLPLEDLAGRAASGDPFTRVVFAERCLAAGEPARAEATLVDLLAAHPEQAPAWVLRSRAELAQGKLAPAYASAQVARNTAGPSAEIHFILGQIQERRAHEDRAVAEYKAALKIDPRHASALLHLGRIELSHTEYGTAIPRLQAAHELEPHDTETLILLARAYLALNRHAEAEALARSATRQSPTLARGWELLGNVLRADLRPERRAGAEAAYRRALELDPALLSAGHQLGSILFERGDYTAAAAAFEQVLHVHPLHKQTHPLLAQCYRRLRRPRDAERLLREYARLDEMDLDTAPLEYTLWAMPHNVAVRLQLAQQYLKYKRPDLASNQVSIVLETDPNNPDALRLREQLRRP